MTESTTTALAEPPVAVCNRCGRTTWAQASIGTDDRMEHSTGGRCGGRFIATGPPDLTTTTTGSSGRRDRASHPVAPQH